MCSLFYHCTICSVRNAHKLISSLPPSLHDIRVKYFIIHWPATSCALVHVVSAHTHTNTRTQTHAHSSCHSFIISLINPSDDAVWWVRYLPVWSSSRPFLRLCVSRNEIVRAHARGRHYHLLLCGPVQPV